MKKAVLIPKSIVEQSLGQKPLKGKNRLNPFYEFATKNQLPIIIFENHEVESDIAESMVHEHFSELFICIDGKAIFIVGGKLINCIPATDENGVEIPYEWRGVGITEGETVALEVGDMFFIPAGVPHQQSCSMGTSRLFRIKIPINKG
jgi:mannose-6-phosphate isomerase-like protein (cupin superfamily)